MPKEIIGRKRLPQERQRDLATIAEWYLRGYSATDIAAKLADIRHYSLTSQTILNDLKLIHQRWLESQLVNYDAAQAKELARLDALYDEYWRAWRRSQRDKEVTREEDISDVTTGAAVAEDGSGGSYKYKRVRKYMEKAGRDGSHVFLKGAQEVIRMRSEILGLFAPDRVIVDWREQADALGIENVANSQFEKMVDHFTEALQDDE